MTNDDSTATSLSAKLPAGLRDARLHAPARGLADAVAERNLKAALGLGEAEIRLGRYRLIRTLGRGGMGVVFEAQDTLLDRRVALKVMSLSGERAEAMAYKEARSLGRLTHANVVHVFDVEQSDGLFHIAMEYIEGPTLQQWLQAEPRAWQEIVEMFLAAGRGLAAAHAVGIVHCDFKPTNVLLGNDGRILVVDFGIAAWLESDEPGVLTGPQTLSNDATVRIYGTRGYISPERLAGGPVDPRSDQYGFCVSLWEALFGARPDDDSSDADSRQPAPAIAPEISERLRTQLRRGLAANPDDRHLSMDALLETLARIAAHPSRPAVAPAGLPVLMMACAAILAGIAWYLLPDRDQAVEIVADDPTKNPSDSEPAVICRGMDRLIYRSRRGRYGPMLIVPNLPALSEYASEECPGEHRCARLATLVEYALDAESRPRYLDPNRAPIEHAALAQMLEILDDSCPAPEGRLVHGCLSRGAAALEAELCAKQLLDARICSEASIAAATVAARDRTSKTDCPELIARWTVEGRKGD